MATQTQSEIVEQEQEVKDYLGEWIIFLIFFANFYTFVNWAHTYAITINQGPGGGFH